MIHRLTFVIFILLQLVHFHASAQTTITPHRREAEKLVKQGDLKLRYGDVDGAILHYTSAIESDRTYVQAWIARSKAYQMRGMTRESDMDLAEADRLQAFTDALYDTRLRIRLLQNDYRSALTDIDSMLARDPSATEYFDLRGLVNFELENYDAAMSDYNFLLELNPRDTITLLKRAVLHAKLQDFSRAHADADSALALNPTSALAHDIKGIIFLEQEDYRMALAEFNSAVQ